MEEEKKKKSKIVKRDAVEYVLRWFDICNDVDHNVVGSHVHFRGGIQLVDDNPEHKIKLKVPKSVS